MKNKKGHTNGQIAVLKFPGKKKTDAGLVGLTLSDDHLTVAQVLMDRGEPVLQQCERVGLEGKPVKDLLPEQISAMGLKGHRCNCVLAPRDYNVYLVEAPAVEPEELKAAVRWKVKDLMDVPAEDAAIDLFPLPEDAFQGRSKMLYVVAAQKSRVQQLIELTQRAELELVSIDIPELAMRNLVSRFANDDNGLAFMALKQSGSSLNLTRQGSLYLTRKISTQVEDGVAGTTSWEGLRDRLALEIQRSLDYYESQMGQNPVSRLMLAPRDDAEELAAGLNEAMGVEVDTLRFADRLAHDKNITPATLHNAALAIGAALRNDEVALN